MRRMEYKKIDRETADWELDAGSRKWIDQGTPARRRLRKRLRRMARKKIDRTYREREEE